MGIKYFVNENFFKKWTQEMAYVLGYFYADGSMENASYLRGKYIRFSSAERNNLAKIKKWMESEHKIVEIKCADGRVLYLLRIGSHKLYNDLEKIGLYPRKSLTIKFPKIPKKFVKDFIRGYLDGDGCVRIEMRKGKTQEFIIGKLCTVFTSGSKKFLEELALNIQKNAQTNQLKIYNGTRSYKLAYSTADGVKIFKFLYANVKKGVYLERKSLVYAKYFNLRPQRVDKEVKSVLQYLGA